MRESTLSGRRVVKAKRAHADFALLSEVATEFAHIAAPIRWQRTARYVPMKGTVRPITNFRHATMLDRIEVNVVDVAFKIGVVAYGVLPVTTLPKSSLTPRFLAGRTPRKFRQPARKASLDDAPARGVVGVTLWQLPNCMQVIRQNTYSNRLKWITLLRRFIDSPQPIDLSHQEITRSVGKCNREEKCSTSDLGSAISGHGSHRVTSLAFRWDGSAWARFALPTLRFGEG